MPGHGRTGSIRWTPQPPASMVLILVLAAGAALAAGGASPASPASAEPPPRGVPAHADLAPRCCRTPGAMVLHRACSDGSAMPLNCPMFRLNPAVEEDDVFELSADGQTLSIWNDNIREFCLLHSTDGVVEALICHHEDHSDHDDHRPAWWYDMASTMSWLSVACLALTFLAHLLLPDLRDLQGRCHMGAVASLALGLLVLACLQSFNMDEPACTVSAFLTYYWLLSAFFWLNITSFNVWRSVVLEHVRFRERTLFLWYCVVCLGAPLVLLVLLLTAHLLPATGSLQPGLGTTKCWFRDDRATWLWFYWPLAVLLGLNVVYFVWTTARLWQQYGDGDGNQCRRKLLRRRFLLSLKLFFIMGISWIFELISSAAEGQGNYAWYVTDAFNAMQGVVILLVLVVLRRRVWRALHRLRPCGLRPPERWAYPSDMRDCEDACTDTEDDEEAVDAARRPHELKVLPAATNGHAAPKAATVRG